MVRITTKYFVISIAAELLEVHPQTLRQFEREGLIKPSRSKGNVRLYSEDDLERVRMILRLRRELGVNLAGIEVILGMRERMQAIHNEMYDMMERMHQHFENELIRRETAVKHPLARRARRDILRIKVDEKE